MDYLIVWDVAAPKAKDPEAEELRRSRSQIVTLVYECLAYYEDHQAEIDPLAAAQTAHLEG